jgi:hypothetical protein
VSATARWARGLVAGVVLVLVAQFLLDAWADQNQSAHWIQHALLFVGGLVAGSALLRLYQLGGGAR